MRKYLYLRAYIALGILFTFLLNAVGPLPSAQADVLSLPRPVAMLGVSPKFNPPILKGLKVHPEQPFKFDFILDVGDRQASKPLNAKASQGNNHVDNQELKQEANKLIKYFLASLTIPEEDLWVNLSPYEKNRIVPDAFGKTEMGRDLLAEDYMLKQITASLMYPEGEAGKKFWKRIYEEAAKRFGTTNVPVNTFNKVWILPDKAVVYENLKANAVYVTDSRLKVMLEQDYLSIQKHQSQPGDMFKSELERTCPQAGCQASKPLNAKAPQGNYHPPESVNTLGSQIIREIIIPELNKEVNEGANFAQLRQVYNSLILANWYKNKIKDSILAEIYENKNKVAGVEYKKSIIQGNSVILSETKDLKTSYDSSASPQNDTELIYQHYLQAFKKGSYNFIKEEQDPLTGQMIPRKYFSGGLNLNDAAMSGAIKPTHDFAMGKHGILIQLGVDLQSSNSEHRDAAQQAHEKFFPIDLKPMALRMFNYNLGIFSTIKEKRHRRVLYPGSGVDMPGVITTTNGRVFDMVDDLVVDFDQFREEISKGVTLTPMGRTFLLGKYENGHGYEEDIRTSFMTMLKAELYSMGIMKDDLFDIHPLEKRRGFSFSFYKIFPGETQARKYTFNFIKGDIRYFHTRTQYDVLYHAAGWRESDDGISIGPMLKKMSQFLKPNAVIVISPYEVNWKGEKQIDVSGVLKDMGFQEIPTSHLVPELISESFMGYFGYGIKKLVFQRTSNPAMSADHAMRDTPSDQLRVYTGASGLRPGQRNREIKQEIIRILKKDYAFEDYLVEVTGNDDKNFYVDISKHGQNKYFMSIGLDDEGILQIFKFQSYWTKLNIDDFAVLRLLLLSLSHVYGEFNKFSTEATQEGRGFIKNFFTAYGVELNDKKKFAETSGLNPLFWERLRTERIDRYRQVDEVEHLIIKSLNIDESKLDRTPVEKEGKLIKVTRYKNDEKENVPFLRVGRFVIIDNKKLESVPELKKNIEGYPYLIKRDTALLDELFPQYDQTESDRWNMDVEYSTDLGWSVHMIGILATMDITGAQIRKSNFVDLGGGFTGILAIAAYQLGAKRLILYEKNESSVRQLRLNLSNNGIPESAYIVYEKDIRKIKRLDLEGPIVFVIDLPRYGIDKVLSKKAWKEHPYNGNRYLEDWFSTLFRDDTLTQILNLFGQYPSMGIIAGGTNREEVSALLNQRPDFRFQGGSAIVSQEYWDVIYDKKKLYPNSNVKFVFAIPMLRIVPDTRSQQDLDSEVLERIKKKDRFEIFTIESNINAAMRDHNALPLRLRDRERWYKTLGEIVNLKKINLDQPQRFDRLIELYDNLTDGATEDGMTAADFEFFRVYSEVFDKEYYSAGTMSSYSRTKWDPALFMPRMEAFIKGGKIKPTDKILDYGSALGFYVRALREKGYEAWGAEISSFAVAQSDPSIRNDVFLLDNIEVLKEMEQKKFDVVIVKHVLEHIPIKILPRFLITMSRLAKRAFFVLPIADAQGRFINDDEELDITHVIRKEKSWWLKLFGSTFKEDEQVSHVFKGEGAKGTLSVFGDLDASFKQSVLTFENDPAMIPREAAKDEILASPYFQGEKSKLFMDIYDDPFFDDRVINLIKEFKDVEGIDRVVSGLGMRDILYLKGFTNELFVASELRRQGYEILAFDVRIGTVRTSSEVDLIVRKNGRIIPIELKQITYNSRLKATALVKKFFHIHETEESTFLRLRRDWDIFKREGDYDRRTQVLMKHMKAEDVADFKRQLQDDSRSNQLQDYMLIVSVTYYDEDVHQVPKFMEAIEDVENDPMIQHEAKKARINLMIDVNSYRLNLDQEPEALALPEPEVPGQDDILIQQEVSGLKIADAFNQAIEILGKLLKGEIDPSSAAYKRMVKTYNAIVERSDIKMRIGLVQGIINGTKGFDQLISVFKKKLRLENVPHLEKLIKEVRKYRSRKGTIKAVTKIPLIPPEAYDLKAKTKDYWLLSIAEYFYLNQPKDGAQRADTAMRSFAADVLYPAEKLMMGTPMWDEFRKMNGGQDPKTIYLSGDDQEVSHQMDEASIGLSSAEIVYLSIDLKCPEQKIRHIVVVDRLENIRNGFVSRFDEHRESVEIDTAGRRLEDYILKDNIRFGEHLFLLYTDEDQLNRKIFLNKVTFGSEDTKNQLRGKGFMGPVFANREIILKEHFRGWRISGYPVDSSTVIVLKRLGAKATSRGGLTMEGIIPDPSMSSLGNRGGIDMRDEKTFIVQDEGQNIKFHIDPAMLQAYKNTTGFIPVITDMRLLVNVKEFLGASQ